MDTKRFHEVLAGVVFDPHGVVTDSEKFYAELEEHDKTLVDMLKERDQLEEKILDRAILLLARKD